MARDRGARAVDGAKRLGRTLGPTATLGIGGVLSLGVVIWGLAAAAQRPMKKVLRARGRADRSEEDDEADNAADDEPNAPAARSRTAPRNPPRRREKRRGERLAEPRILGVAALVLGVPALLIGWLSSVQSLMLLAALVGVGVGIAGVLASRADRGEIHLLPVAGTMVCVLALVVILGATFVVKNKPGDEAVAATDQTPESTQTSGKTAPQSGGKAAPANGLSTAPALRPANASPRSPSIADWGEVLDPDGDCRFTVANNALVIDVPAIPHGLTEGIGKGNAPRVLRELEGDFSIQVKVCGSFHPQAKVNSPGVPFQAGGLIVWDGPDHYIRFVRSGQERKGNIVPVIALSLREAGKMTGQPTQAPDQDVYLRLERRGNDLSGSYSLDANQWKHLQSFHTVFPTRATVGLIALNAVQQPLTVRFEDLELGR